MRSIRLAFVAALVAAAVIVPAAPAAAAPIFDMNQLAIAIQAGGTVTLDQNISEPNTQLYVRNDVTIDFNGFDLVTDGSVIMPGVTLTVIGEGSWTANATVDQRAGINNRDSTLIVDGPDIVASSRYLYPGIGSNGGSPGPITINSGSITATGGRDGGAGIGGGIQYSNSGTLTVNGGTVTAYGGSFASGIGCAYYYGYCGATIVNGGTVVAVGGYAGAGIGGAGYYRDGGSLFVGEGATVTVSSPSSWAVNGTVTVAGTLVIPAGNRDSILVAPTTVTSTGRITGEGTIEGNPYVAGAVLTNHGIVANASVSNIADGNGNLTVLDHSYKLSFDGNFAGADPVDPVRVYATTLADGERTLPTTTRPGYLGLGWNTAADGSGTTITQTTPISGDLTLYAQWSTGGYLISPSSATAIAGTSPAFTVGEIANFALVDATSDFTFSSDNGADVVAGNRVDVTIAGLRTITATKVSDSSISLDSALTVVADAANPADLDLGASSLTANQFGSVTLSLELFDAYGNPLPTDDVVVTSDQPTDQIVGMTVTFPHASPHVITASLGGLSDSLLIEVSPAALAATGVEPVVPIGAAAILLLLGAGALGYRRRIQ